uniref:non-specific serine/threonine protein kinase n=1 Tax=Magallana gigas TaxID=29159 RepID=K1RGW2_MAGGI|eukprot:XP_011416907.1 PREDICTED: serine/threonine-protein kinase PINK1, mitochondrial [Crassostrea gigas]
MFVKVGFGPLAQTLKDPCGSFLTNNTSTKKWFLKGKLFLENIIKRRVQDGKLIQNAVEINKNALVPASKSPSTISRFASRYAVATVARELRNRAALEFSRNRRPIFSFVAVMLSSAAAEEDDEVSGTIRNAYAMKVKQTFINSYNFSAATFSDFQIGQMIGQGCNSAVYEAKLISNEVENMHETNVDLHSPTEKLSDVDSNESFEVIMESDYDVESEFSNNILTTSDVQAESADLPFFQNQEKYDLAIKMMFNYDFESNADTIFQGMIKEITPARLSPEMEEESLWLVKHRVKLKTLPPHSNIVDMQGIFVDHVPKIDNDEHRYPAALPTRLNPENGLGRNKTLFLVMKKYDMTLKSFVSETDVNLNTRCSLVSQLMEGIAHMAEHGVAHRDLKSDNILVDLSNGQPKLVISDFGCCLAEPEYGLIIPYNTSNVDKGGNAALMPPEIALAEPGRNAWLDYRKSDIWTAGTLVYEIFGEENPFYKGPLNSRTYDEKDLSPLPSRVPYALQKLTKLLLKKDPSSRPNPRVAADIALMVTLFPKWIDTCEECPSAEMIRKSIVLLAASNLLQPNAKKDNSLASFLQRVEISSLSKSLALFRNN